jgi:hypothetical protein
MRSLARAVAAAALVYAAPTEATTFITNGSGELTAATGVIVNGATYDVAFVDGTCRDLFSGCDSSDDFAFTTQSDALAAAQALYEQVFSAFVFFTWDRVFGCEDDFSCLVIIPYTAEVDFTYLLSGINFHSIGSGIAQPNLEGGGPQNIDTTTDSTEVLAVFTPRTVSAVPEPSTWMMMLLGFGLVGLTIKKARKHALSKLACSA